jgi:hypothetical protein
MRWNRVQVFLFLLLPAGFFLFSGCHSEQKNNTFPDVADSSIVLGRALSKIYCQSCHALPDPSQADAKTWFNGILPQMGPRLGIFSHHFQNYPSYRYDRYLPIDFYPSKPLLPPEDWQHIIEYYCATAPDSLPAQQRQQKIEGKLPYFKLIIPTGKFPVPETSFLKLDTTRKPRSILVGDAARRNLIRFNALLTAVDSVPVGGPVVDFIRSDHYGWIACDIGILNPNNGKFGKLVSLPADSSAKWSSRRVIYDSLERPVQVTEVDLNQDGRKDELICEFGNMQGALSWLENLGDGRFKRHVLQVLPGAIKAVIRDYNGDGLPDIWCLFAQGDEKIILYTNLGGGKFSQQTLLRFPPINGSSSFELDDFNGDGFADILYTCGDNADYSAIFKPYHGIYIFMNDGKNHFTRKYFFPVNGCYKAMAADFDGDGDLDIASIAFFPDFNRQPEESFMYLENQGNLHFKPYSFPEAAWGRWLTMDIGDVDGDGKPDILLGNFSVAPSFTPGHPDWKLQPPFFLLKNIHP